MNQNEKKLDDVSRIHDVQNSLQIKKWGNYPHCEFVN